MKMAKYCANCGKELDENADICLGCGVFVEKKNKKTTTNCNSNKNKNRGLPAWAIVLIVLGCVILIPIIIIFLIIVFAINVAHDVIDHGEEYFDKVNDYIKDYNFNYVIDEGTIGDSLKIDDLIFTLNKVVKYDSIDDMLPYDGNEFLVFFFEIKNVSNDDIKTITCFDFKGKVDDKVFLPVPWLFNNEIDGVYGFNKNVKPGEVISGYVAYEVSKDWKTFDLTYKEILEDDDGSIVFYVKNEIENNNLEV